jgi:antitoxin component YwqK of YwqJK toxin-antitoxin module
MSYKNLIIYSLIIGSSFLYACGNQATTPDTTVGPDKGLEAEEARSEDSEFSFEGLEKGLEVIKDTDDFNETIEFSRKKTDYAKQGLFIRKDSIGRLLETAFYRNDTLHGSRILYYPETGKKQVVENYKNGNFDGIFQAYYPSGLLEQEGIYIVNVMDSTWVRYYDTGQVKEEVVFRDNEENGPFKEYHANGNIKAEGFFKDGDHEHGLLKLYDEMGELIKTMNCKNGICKTIWKKEEIQ